MRLRQITRGETFPFEFTFAASQVPAGEDVGTWTLEVRYGQAGKPAQFVVTPTQDGSNELLFAGSLTAAQTAALATGEIIEAVWRTDNGAETCLHTNGIGVTVPVVDSVLGM